MALNEPQETSDDFPAPVGQPRSIPVASILLAAGLLALIVLLALSY